MDKEKLEKYAGYAGLGLVGGSLGIILMMTEVERLTPFIIFFAILGGCLGGVIAKKWWGALVGGFVLSGLILIILVLLVIWVVSSIGF